MGPNWIYENFRPIMTSPIHSPLRIKPLPRPAMATTASFSKQYLLCFNFTSVALPPCLFQFLEAELKKKKKKTTEKTLASEKMETKPTEISSAKMFGGYNKRYKHFSPTLGCSMTFHIYLPPSPSPAHQFPVLYWLSGLTCTDENFIAKSGAQRAASRFGIALVAPDTSPRGLNVEGEADSWDFGVGAGFYLNAKQEKWKNWQMYDYIVKELPDLLTENFPQLNTSKASIFGHSMGGHGALTIFLKNLDKYKSVSAFSPVVNPINCPWGQKAFSNYLGDNKAEWEEYDATCLISKYHDVSRPILIDQGEDDKFLKDQLMPHKFEEACKAGSVPLNLRLHPGYDHSYFFIASFIDDHISHHAQSLNL